MVRYDKPKKIKSGPFAALFVRPNLNSFAASFLGMFDRTVDVR